MTCLRNEQGQTLCHIVDHPDRPNESFCSTCQHRFRKAESPVEGLPILAFLVSVLLIVVGQGYSSSQRSLPSPQGVVAPSTVESETSSADFTPPPVEQPGPQTNTG